MLALIGWVILAFLYAWLMVRVRVHTRLMRDWGEERYARFQQWDWKIVNGVLGFLAVLFSYNFIVHRPGDIPTWLAVVIVILLMYLPAALLAYKQLLGPVWELLKEPFRKVDKRDLKYRIRGRLNFIRLTTQVEYPVTAAVLNWIGRLFTRKYKGKA